MPMPARPGRRRIMPLCVGAILIAVACARCGSGSPVAPGSIVPPGPGPVPIPSAPQVFVGAGDIAMCDATGDETTARLLDGIDGMVFALGDNAYLSGSTEN